MPGKSHGWRSLVGCSPWGHYESGTNEPLHFHFSPSCIGEGSGNPLQCSCLENPRDGGEPCTAVYGVAHSRARLKRLSSSSIPLYTYIYHIFIYSSVIETLGCFYVFVIVNSAAMNTEVYVTFQSKIFFGYMLSSEIDSFSCFVGSPPLEFARFCFSLIKLLL